MSIDTLIATWRDVRSGLSDEVELISAEQFSFRASPETRTVTELVQHIIETQKFLVGETCRDDSSLLRQSFADHLNEYASDVRSVSDKAGLLNLLATSMDQTEASLRAKADCLGDTIMGFDGKPRVKADFLNFVISHEMYHRGQLTVYQRLMGIEPQLTQRLKKFFAAQAAG
jgi:uncharacterized damage-inducible protein DinB